MALAGLMLYATVISVVGVVRRVQLTRREALSIAITAALCGLFAYLCTLPLSVCVSCRAATDGFVGGGGQQRFSW
jgi:hypothetical protein